MQEPCPQAFAGVTFAPASGPSPSLPPHVHPVPRPAVPCGRSGEVRALFHLPPGFPGPHLGLDSSSGDCSGPTLPPPHGVDPGASSQSLGRAGRCGQDQSGALTPPSRAWGRPLSRREGVQVSLHTAPEFIGCEWDGFASSSTRRAEDEVLQRDLSPPSFHRISFADARF